MSTNFYWQISKDETCSHCGHTKSGELVHIGKRSGGWQFLFQTYGNVKSWRDWKNLLSGGAKIEDEYGRTYTIEQLEEIVKNTISGQQHQHFDFIDDDGYAFYERDFS